MYVLFGTIKEDTALSKIIAFGHQKRVGKDTACKFFVSYVRTTYKNSDIKQTAFANELKDQCYRLFKWAGMQDRQYYDANPEQRERILFELKKTPRQIWIEYGNYCREIYPHIWIDFVIKSFLPQILLISDVRFPNEANRILDMGGYVYRIINPNITPTSDAADDALIGYDRWTDTIYNDSDLNSFYSKIVKLADTHMG